MQAHDWRSCSIECFHDRIVITASAFVIHYLLPQGIDRGIVPILAARALRGFADGFVAVLLPVYLLTLGLGGVEVGAIATASLFGSAMATLAVGTWGHRWTQRTVMLGAALLMAATGLGFSSQSAFWLLLVIAFVGTINPSTGDVSVFLPLEHARLAAASDARSRTDLFARYALTGTMFAAIGALASGIPDRAVNLLGVQRQDALRGMFILYGLIGFLVWLLYRKLPSHEEHSQVKPAPLGPSRAVVMKLAALFSMDSFAGGLVVSSLMALWLVQKFGLSLAAAGLFFFCSNMLAAVSQLAAPKLAQRIGLVNTMVWTHIPANMCLIAAAFSSNVYLALGLLLTRALMSSMDVPTRSAFVMSVVQPHERAAAASFTAVPRSLAAAASPLLAGWLFQSGWTAMPLVVCGVVKITYDLALWRAFRRFRHAE